MKFRGLRPEEIEIRVGSVSEKGATLLFYKDARCDMNILDETVGEANWMRDHKEVKGNLFCGVGIRSCVVSEKIIEKADEWVWKWDCGTESYTEKEKGESSDSFKRACFNWGIGRELYTSPFTFVKCATKQKDPGDKRKGFELEDRYQFNGAFVSEIEYEETDAARKISKVTVCDKSGNAIFKWNKRKAYVKDEKRTAEELASLEKITAGGVDFLQNLIVDTGTDLKKLLEFYKIKRLEDMTTEQFNDCVKKLDAKKGKE